MNKKSIYISCPAFVAGNILDSFIDKVKTYSNIKAEYWKKGTTYDSRKLIDSDYFAIILPDNSFVYPIEELSLGCKKELKLAIQLKKKIFICYQTVSTKEFLIYEAELIKNDSVITGISGTTNCIYKINEELKMKESKRNYDYESLKDFVVRLHERPNTIEESFLDKGDILYLESISYSENNPKRLLVLF